MYYLNIYLRVVSTGKQARARALGVLQERVKTQKCESITSIHHIREITKMVCLPFLISYVCELLVAPEGCIVL